MVLGSFKWKVSPRYQVLILFSQMAKELLNIYPKMKQMPSDKGVAGWVLDGYRIRQLHRTVDPGTGSDQVVVTPSCCRTRIHPKEIELKIENLPLKLPVRLLLWSPQFSFRHEASLDGNKAGLVKKELYQAVHVEVGSPCTRVDATMPAFNIVVGIEREVQAGSFLKNFHWATLQLFE